MFIVFDKWFQKYPDAALRILTLLIKPVFFAGYQILIPRLIATPLPSEDHMPGPGYIVGRFVKYCLLNTLLILNLTTILGFT